MEDEDEARMDSTKDKNLNQNNSAMNGTMLSRSNQDKLEFWEQNNNLKTSNIGINSNLTMSKIGDEKYAGVFENKLDGNIKPSINETESDVGMKSFTSSDTPGSGTGIPHAGISRKDHRSPGSGDQSADITRLCRSMERGEDSGALQQWLVSSVARMDLTEVDSVNQWLEDLRMMTDTECMCVLQGKSLTKDTTDLVFTAAKSTRDSIEVVKGRAHIIWTEFVKLFRKVEKERWRHIKSGSLRLTCQIRSLLHECNANVASPSVHFSPQEQQVMEECAKLVQYVESHVDINGHQPDKATLIQFLTCLGQSFSSLVDLSLEALLQKLLEIVRDSSEPEDVRATLSNLVSLGLEGEHMCYLMAKVGGIEILFNLSRDPSKEYAHALALRVMATICCLSESIAQLEQLNGIECMSDILSSCVLSELVRAEAAGVIAQVTSPCLEHYQHSLGFIENLGDLVKSLTGLCAEASTQEVFLLGAAALANITFMDSMACDFLLQYGTAAVLIEGAMLDRADSFFAKDQVATVLANMSAIESCIPDITENLGVELLVHLLQEAVEDAGTEAELAACERVLQKSAIALSRLVRDSDTACRVTQLEGVLRLIQLCQEPEQRNHSDAVLVACLAALRKLCSVGDIDVETMENEIKELIQPRLLDSFLMCSNLDESIV